MTAPARIRKGDLNRVRDFIKTSGFTTARVRIDPDGTIDIMLGLDLPDSQAVNPLDRVLPYAV